ncbi:alpha-protein kinase 2 [Kryptolebias marmoratus]|uniref:non-specific serine/threonine protein kinase n=1 Tax=Kryptolebias marmoratus TaxID=37003 RepID=A0A3Q3B4Y3_KRYMA|nr:alpha-protein kinase 2 [Kryptolebias marmoratus]
MDPSLLYPDDQTPAPTVCQSGDSHIVSVLLSAHEPGTETESGLLDVTDESTLNASTDANSLKCLPHSCHGSQYFSVCLEPLLRNDTKEHRCLNSPEPESEASPLLPRDFLPVQSSSAESEVKQEPPPSFSHTKVVTSPESSKDVRPRSEALTKPPLTVPFSTSSFSFERTSYFRSLSAQSDSLDSDAMVGPMSDLYIFEGDTHGFILSQTVDPSEITPPEYLPLSQTEMEKADHDCSPNVLMCDSEGIVSQCHHGFSEEQAIENNLSEVSQHEELRPPAADAWEVELVSVSGVRSAKAEVADLSLHLQRSDSPVELWVDAHQDLTGEGEEDVEVLDKASHLMMQEHQVSDYSNDSKRIGCSIDDSKGWGPPIKRWSSVDSWATALSDWTEIVEDPSEDIAAAFAEIGAEIDALTQSLDKLNAHTESDTLQENLKTTEQEGAQENMGVQDPNLKTQSIPESSIHSDQSCLPLGLEARGPEHQDNSNSKIVESSCDPENTTEGERKLAELPFVGSPRVTVAFSEGYSTDMTEIALRTVNASCSGLDLSQSDGYLKTFEDDIFLSSEAHPIKLNITEDTDLIIHPELVFKKPCGDGLCQVTDECSLSQRGSVDEQEVTFEGNTCPTDPDIFNRLSPTNPGVDRQVYPYTDEWFNALPDLLGESQVELQLGSFGFTTHLAPHSSDSSFIGQTSSSSEADQTQIDCLGCDHVQCSTPCSSPDGVTDKPFEEGDEELILKKQNTIIPTEKPSPDGVQEPHTKNTKQSFLTVTEEITNLSRELVNFAFLPLDHFVISENNRVAYFTLDIDDPFIPRPATPTFKPTELEGLELKMPHKTHKNPAESKARSKKEKSGGHHHSGQAHKKQENTPHHVSTQQTCKQQESRPTTGESHIIENSEAGIEVKDAKIVIETSTGGAEKKPHGKKKKKHGQGATVKSEGEPSVDVGNGAKPKTTMGRVDMFEAKLGAKTGKAQRDGNQSVSAEKKSKQPEEKVPQEEQPLPHTDHKNFQTKNSHSSNDKVIKRRRMSGDKFGKIVSALESKLPKTVASVKPKEEESQGNVGVARKKPYSEVVKQKIPPPKEDPKVVQPIQAASVSGDPQSLCLWCQFAAVHSDYTVTWSREGTVLAESKRSAGDESRVTLNITNATHKDLGRFECRLSSSHGAVTLDYLLTYEVLSEIVIPASPKIISSPAVDVSSEEEDAHFSKLFFREDFLSEQYFGENHPISIITEKDHFGEGMHRRAFRTTLKAGQIPLLVPGHACVLKVHNSISYGTKNNDELVQKNFNLAVEECQVQNTAREYIKAYTSAAQSVDAFGDVPEIIPIYLVHRPSNDVPYATLEEELIGDFVKYSVKDGKEINLMRRDSEPGQKCCAFQHWVYQNTEGNLLVTDMQGVGMKLTDVGIATCKKGYKGFKGNCATSFIDQFKALHQCNKYCEILGLSSLQPKPKKASAAPKPKPQPSAAPKKKIFGPTVKGKS